MREIPLNQGKIGKFALVDDSDFEWLSQWKWHLKDTGYAARGEYLGQGKAPKTILMHRAIMGHPKGKIIDHIDCNRLNNCRSNLRIASTGQNIQNQGLRQGRLAKGVYENRGLRRTTYRAIIVVDKRPISLGTFLTISAAASAYNKAATKHFGKNARLNDLSQLPEFNNPLASQEMMV